MQRDGSSANPPPEDPRDSVVEHTGTGASGPGEAAYDEESQTGDIGGEAAIDLEDKARRMAEGDASADPAVAADPSLAGPESSPQPDPDAVTGTPEVQSGG